MRVLGGPGPAPQLTEPGDRRSCPGPLRPVHQLAPGGDGVGVVRAQHPEPCVQQLAEPGDRPGGVPGLRGPVRQVTAGAEGVGVVGPSTRSCVSSSSRNLVIAPAVSPASPFQWARLPRVLRVLGWSGPWLGCSQSHVRPEKA
jgi:hypothetical protein